MELNIRVARREDTATLLHFIEQLAAYERAEREVTATLESLEDAIFGLGSVTRALICEQGTNPIGMAIWFYNFSTWQARKGLYLEDLYVAPAARGVGAGKALLRRLAQIAVEEGCGRFEWSVQDWNKPAILAYEAIGAERQQEWVRYRLAGNALAALATG
ncbi:GNAT family N-acetyltransferase (plasmid) [Agrobacterium sp. rho-13.3]|uniref:GNAT family N-acetyltransferase n=1 Tax=Agrobacterium sp. rho-13.3 TaxID=3072980 RepID=UPI002A0F905E|nr:GNAT family N-acetyltransferase [Agrobacterium sp. rho-13.3]MDX8310230.1 GNAT family N-acetyltransferase [Agrobacterium sp. rho-13.3]